MGGNLGLVFEIIGDPSRAEAALNSFQVTSEAAFASAQAAAKATTDAMLGISPKIDLLKDGLDDIAPAAKAGLGGIPRLAKEAEYSMEQAHEGARLLEVMLGTRLPRAISTAVGTMIPSIATLSGYLIGIFAARELAMAIANWDKFKEAAMGLLGPFSELEVKVANALGFLQDYSQEARALAEQELKNVQEGQKLQARVIDAQNQANNMRLSGVNLIYAQTQQAIDKLKEEKALAADVNKSYFDRLIVARELQGQIELGREVNREVQDQERDRAEKAKEYARQRAEALSQERQDYEYIIEALQRWSAEDASAAQKTTEMHRRLAEQIHQQTADEQKRNAAEAAARLATEKFLMNEVTLNNELLGIDRQRALVARAAGTDQMDSQANQTKHLTAARKELIGVTQTLKNMETEFQQALQGEMSALEDTTQNVQGIAEQFAQLIGGTKAAAEVKGAFDAALSIEYLAQFIASYGTDTDALLASVQYGLAAAEMFKVSGGGGGGGGSSSGGGGGGGGSSRSGGSNGGGNNGGAASGPGGGWNVEGPGAQTASPTINLHLNGQQFASVVVPVITQGVQNGSVRLTASTTVS